MTSKMLVAFVFLLALIVSIAGQSFYGTADVAEFRSGRDREFRNKTESPLLDDDFADFKGLSYYPLDESFKVAGVFRSTPSEQYFLMPTSSGNSVKYKKLGEVEFVLDGVKHVLNAYQSELILTNDEWNKKYGHAMFIPFRDMTNGETTYPGGRYLYLKIPESDKIDIDFNLAFNPSCAYGSERFSCPIPPRANSLSVAIAAGEKSFNYTKKPQKVR